MPAPQKTILVRTDRLYESDDHVVLHIMLANKERTPLVSFRVNSSDLRESLSNRNRHPVAVHAEIVSPKR